VLLRDRHKEVLFGLILLLSVPLVAGVGEGLYRLRQATKAPSDQMDWVALREAAIHPVAPGEMERFIPGAVHGHVRVNALGFRGPDIAVTKPADTLRVVFLGNSKMLGAELPEDLTIAGRATALLETASQSCRIEYVLAAGPSNTADMLRDLVIEEIRPLNPDAYVVLVGTPLDAVNDYVARHPDAANLIVPPDPLWEVSKLWNAVSVAFRLERERRRAARIDLRRVLPDAEVRAIGTAWFNGLAEAVDGVPTVAIAYRDALRVDMTPAEKEQATVWERLSTRGVAPDDILRVRDQLIAALRGVAEARGWTMIDPIAGFPSTPSHFYDTWHLNARGTAVVAEATVDALTPILASLDRACVARGTDR